MKKALLLLMVFFLLLPLLGMARENRIEEPFDFETQKIEGWRELPRSEKGTLFNVPSDVVNRMTTDALLQTFLNYPFAIDLVLSNTYYQGYMALRSEFEPLTALVARIDLPASIIRKYQRIHSASESVSDNEIVHAILLVALCTQQDINSLFTADEMQQLLGVLTESDLKDYEFHLANESSLWLDTRYQSNKTQLQNRAIYVKTPNGTNVEVLDYTSLTQWTSTEITAINNSVTSSYVVTVTANPNKYYNCHSYAWYSTSTSNNRWMNDPSAYMTDGSYYNSTSSIRTGDKHFMNPTHSGIISSISNSMAYITSKWGSWGVYTGAVTQLPPGYTNPGSPDYYTGSSQWRR